MGWESAVFALATIGGSILFVALLTRHVSGNAGEDQQDSKEEAEER